jgi:DNA-binding CsgD family transcriptional regulator
VDTSLELIGREPELAALHSELDAANNSQGRVVLLEGEAGIGKTSIARAFAGRAAAQGTLVLWGRCLEQEGAPAYWPWLQVLRQLAQSKDDHALRAALGRDAGCLAEICPELTDRLPDLASPPPLSDAAHARFRIFDTAAALWKRVAAIQPLLLIFEDVHWADAASLRMLEFVAGEVSGARLLMLATLRNDALLAQHPLTATLNELRRRAVVQRLALSGLHIEHTARLIELETGNAPTAAATAFVHAKTDGHPLFVVEVARHLARESPDAGAWHVPEGIRAVITSRVSRLSRAAEHLLQRASIVGTHFSFSLLRRLQPEQSAERLLSALDEALAERVVRRADEPGWYRFGHVLTRDTLYDALPLLERARWHERIGLALEEEHRHRLEPVLRLLAHHFNAALPAGSPAKAVDYAMLAAREATARLAYEEAAHCLSLALDATSQSTSVDVGVRCRLTISRAVARMKSGHALAALEDLTEAAHEARHLGAADDLAQAAIEFEEVAWRLGLPGERAQRLLESALAQIGDGDDTIRVKLQSALVRALAFAGQAEHARVLQAQTAELARRLGEPTALHAALRSRFFLPWQPQELEVLLATAHETVAIAQRSGNAERILDATAFRLHLLLATGDAAGFDTDLQRFGELAEALQQPFHRYHAASMRAAQAVAKGHLADAEALARGAVRLGARLPGLDASGTYGMQMFTIVRERGELAQLAPQIAQFVQRTPGSATWRPALALVLAELGEIDAATAKLDELAADRFGMLPRDSLWLVSMAYLAEACVRVRHRSHAQALYDLMSPWSARNVVAGSVGMCYGPADRFLGMLCTLLEQWDAAERHFETAIEMTELQGARLWLAHSLTQFAAMLFERGTSDDRHRADKLLESAQRIATDLSLRALQKRFSDLSQAHPARPRAPVYPGRLSQREAQVLRLIAAGKSNQEIAASISRSPNTVANHVRNILTKLGSANRAEAATFAARNGLV